VPLSDVLGHERVKAALRHALDRGRLPSALLFSGPEGVGKRTLAIEVGRALICEQSSNDACGQCSSCLRIARASDTLADLRAQAQASDEPSAFNLRLHPDLLLVEPSTETIRVEQARAIVSEVGERSFEGRGRAIVIDDAHRLTEQAANALLKSLEEPPAGTHFLLVTASTEALPATIRSRCQRLRFAALPPATIESALVERWGVSPEEARLRTRLSGGSLKTAIAFDSTAYRNLREELIGLIERWGELDELGRLDAAQTLADLDEPRDALRILRSLLRDVALLSEGAAEEHALNIDVRERLSPLAAGAFGKRAAELAEQVERSARALAANAHRGLVMDMLVDGAVAVSGLRGDDWA
jgi:DNA polymerase-3 subunit delta'